MIGGVKLMFEIFCRMMVMMCMFSGLFINNVVYFFVFVVVLIVVWIWFGWIILFVLLFYVFCLYVIIVVSCLIESCLLNVCIVVFGLLCNMMLMWFFIFLSIIGFFLRVGNIFGKFIFVGWW